MARENFHPLEVRGFKQMNLGAESAARQILGVWAELETSDILIFTEADFGTNRLYSGPESRHEAERRFAVCVHAVRLVQQCLPGEN